MASSNFSSKLSLYEAKITKSDNGQRPPIASKFRRDERQPSLRAEELATPLRKKTSPPEDTSDSTSTTLHLYDSSLQLSATCSETEIDDSCFKAGIGDESFTSFDEQMRLAVKREQVRQRRESAKLLGLPADAQPMSLKERMKAFQQT